MLKTNLIIETVGEPDIKALTEREQNALLEALYDSIVEAYKQSLS